MIEVAAAFPLLQAQRGESVAPSLNLPQVPIKDKRNDDDESSDEVDEDRNDGKTESSCLNTEIDTKMTERCVDSANKLAMQKSITQIKRLKNNLQGIETLMDEKNEQNVLNCKLGDEAYAKKDDRDDFKLVENAETKANLPLRHRQGQTQGGHRSHGEGHHRAHAQLPRVLQGLRQSCGRHQHLPGGVQEQAVLLLLPARRGHRGPQLMPGETQGHAVQPFHSQCCGRLRVQRDQLGSCPLRVRV